MTLSIITINRNNATGLRRTIESVVCQTYTDFEYIIIDGASTDESVEVIRKFENLKIWEFEDSETHTISNRLQWISEPDKGIYNAMNKGILKAKGEYLLMLNSGDWLVNETILNQIFIYPFDEDIVFGDILWIEENNSYETVFPENLNFSYFYHQSLGHQAAFIKRNLHYSVGNYDENLKIVSDWYFFIKAFTIYNCSYKHIPIVVSACPRDGISCDPEFWSTIVEERKNKLAQDFPAFIKDYEAFSNLQIEYEKVQLELHNLKRKSLKGYTKRLIKKMPYLYESLKKIGIR